MNNSTVLTPILVLIVYGIKIGGHLTQDPGIQTPENQARSSADPAWTHLLSFVALPY